MAYVKTDWENLPSTDTPITETALDNMENGIEYNDQRLNGTKPMASIVVDDVSCKNMFNPVLYADGQAIVQSNSVVNVSDGEFTFVSSGADMYFGQIVATPGTAYTGSRGYLIDVENLNEITFTITNSVFNRVYITPYDSSKNALTYTYFQSNTGTYTIPTGTKYISIRFGMLNAVSGTTYKTKVQVEAGDTPTTYTPYKAFDNQEVYSFAETRCGVWVDGKPLYRKVIDIGALPNNTTKYINHNISNVDIITNYYGVCKSSNNIHFKLPYTSVATTGSIQVYCTNTQIAVQTDVDRSGYSGYIVIEYTKTTSGTRSIEMVEEENR